MQEITIQETENPRVMKFVAEKTLVEGSLELDRSANVSRIPLAKELFNFPFITRIFITANFVAVAKADVVEWDLIAPNLRNIIAESLENYPNVVLPQTEKTLFFAERTPNPEVVKIISDRELITGFLEIKSKEEVQENPLAKYLFDSFDFVKEIFINDNFVSITKTENVEWDTKVEQIRKGVENFFEQNPHLNLKGIEEEHQAQIFNDREFTETEQKINAIILEYVAPAVENDGGKISLIAFDEQTKTAKMLLQGACSGCPSSTITLKNGIENLLKSLLPNVVESVEAVNG
ncbi:MAG: NifU family protein [Flavobacteriaceae bacterium]|nr:NifU family protein [Flavobacteriaceae bacterium]